MKTYKEIIFQIPDNAIREILMAQLDEMGYEGFEEDGDLLKAYIPEEQFDNAELQNLNTEIVSINMIQERNWNAEWESSFSPVVVDELVAIRADFHESVQGVQYEIIITPKMSFGTGHHATTWLMIQAMQHIDFKDLSVLDFGTGTGVLAILAEKMGAGTILAIDNDDWSVDNARENLDKNQSRNIRVEQMDKLPESSYDVILANINKHILLSFCDEICRKMNSGGKLLMSGILREDLEDIIKVYGIFLGKPEKIEEKNNWLMIAFNKG
jgi:ribosomal protein L11 methyltransferase